jgi:hypothetical protein
MSDSADARPINMSATGLPSTVLPPPDAAARRQLDDALAAPAGERRDRVASVVAANPRYLDAWARLGDHARDQVEAYAAYRVGYHRGLDALRASGWRGSGYVRWAEETNRGFLRALRGLGRVAAEIGEADEAERIRLFIAQLDPGGVPASG